MSTASSAHKEASRHLRTSLPRLTNDTSSGLHSALSCIDACKAQARPVNEQCSCEFCTATPAPPYRSLTASVSRKGAHWAIHYEVGVRPVTCHELTPVTPLGVDGQLRVPGPWGWNIVQMELDTEHPARE